MPTDRDVLVVECEEYEHVDVDSSLWVSDRHTIVLNSEIDGRDVLRASFRGGKLQLQATSYVGVIPLNQHVVLRVRPRVPLANLTRMVIETGHSVLPLRAFREYAGRGNADDWTMDIYADTLLDHVDTILDSGMMRVYRRLEGEGHYPHGRIEVARTVQRFAARGIPNKAAFSWHERSVDVPANRCLKTAMELVLAHLLKERDQPRKGDRAKVKRLAGQLAAFDEVGEDVDLRFLEDPEVRGDVPLPDPRAYYRPALDLALLVVRGRGIALEIGGDDVRMGSLLIDTNKLFENFVRVSLARRFSSQGWAVEVLDGNKEGKVELYDAPDPGPNLFGKPLDALARIDAGAAQPDIVLRDAAGNFPLIAEVKNTVHGKDAQAKDVLPERGEVEQAVTYALRYDLTFTLLIHPWIKGSKGLVYVGRVRTVDVYDYRLDLSQDAGIDTALENLASVVARLAGITNSTT
ncbi:5-methylcytosine restriction system specificity protein McrC [Microbacterium sp. RG1]|uniref:5-methylcytosine restriction system specificity protein McrC n=1 Tax=Microbacterium sp. RG1 TaxID=2489212 RepID=UPI0010CA2C45|nr:hypothetical protein [Microbacterium sp. RG1]QCQ17264.1 hypothetical protein EHF32_11310 [Microbacterium sp. RG1]